MNQIPSSPTSQAWPYWFLVPIYPYGKRATLCREIIPEQMWVFEQVQGIFYVVVPIRMTVVRLQAGGLLVYAPIAPTAECLQLLQELTAQYGAVKYIILPTISGLEHKVNVGPFARHCPQATVFVAPGQWSFPVPLPLTWLGFPPGRTQVLPENSADTPFAAEFDYAILGPLDLRLGQFGEVVFFHRPTGSLLTTDTLISIPETPPVVLTLDPTPLLFHARDQASDCPVESPENLAKGWQRICLFSLYFQASSLNVPDWRAVFRQARQVDNRKASNYFGLYPFQWSHQWPDTFKRLAHGGEIRVAPILQELILNRAPQTVLAWGKQISQWPIKQLIPCHFSAPVATTGDAVRQAFGFLEASISVDQQHLLPPHRLLPPEDLQTLRQIDRWLVRLRLVPPPQR